MRYRLKIELVGKSKAEAEALLNQFSSQFGVKMFLEDEDDFEF